MFSYLRPSPTFSDPIHPMAPAAWYSTSDCRGKAASIYSASSAPAKRELPRPKKRCASVPAVNGPKTLQNPQGFSRFGRPKSAPIVHRKHAGTVPLPHRCRAASATRAGSARRDDARERNQRADIPVSNSRRHGLLLRTKRHTATGKQIQVLVAAVNRHMPATPSRCCRRRRGRTRSTFPGGNPGARAMIPHLPPRPPTSSGSTWRGHGRASTAAMTWSLVGVVTWFLPRNRNEGRRAVESSQCRGKASANSPTAAGSIAHDHVAHSDIAAL
jgi:hypothetical protein